MIYSIHSQKNDLRITSGKPEKTSEKSSSLLKSPHYKHGLKTPNLSMHFTEDYNPNLKWVIPLFNEMSPPVNTNTNILTTFIAYIHF